MTQTNAAFSFGGGIGAWIFRVLLVAAAAFMVYTWFAPWWITDIAVIPGEQDMVLHPWGVEVVRQVRASADPELYAMPGFFAPFVWTYFGLAMLALLASMFVTINIPLGPIKLPLAMALIAAVGLSYMAAVGIAYYVGDMRASAIDISFVGEFEYTDPMSHRKMQMEASLQDGYWYALYAGIALVVLSIVRFLFVRKWRA